MAKNRFALEIIREGKVVQEAEGSNLSSILATYQALSPRGGRNRDSRGLSVLDIVALTSVDLTGREEARTLGEGFPGYNPYSPSNSSHSPATLGYSSSVKDSSSEVTKDSLGHPLKVVYEREWEIGITKDGEVKSVFLQRTTATYSNGGGVFHSISVDPPVEVLNGDSVRFTHTTEVDVEGLEFADPALPWLREVGDAEARVRVLGIDGQEVDSFLSEVKVYSPSIGRITSSSEVARVSSDGRRRGLPTTVGATASSNEMSVWTGTEWERGDAFRSGARARARGRTAISLRLFPEELPIGDSWENSHRSPSEVTDAYVFIPAGGERDQQVAGLYIPFVGVPSGSGTTQPLTLPSPAAMLSETQNNGDYGNSKYLSLVMFDPPIPLSKEESFSLKISALFSVGVPDSVVAEYPGVEVRRPTPPSGYLRQSIPGLGGEPLGRGSWEGDFTFPANLDSFSGYSIQSVNTPYAPSPQSKGFTGEVPPEWKGKGFFLSGILEKGHSTPIPTKLSLYFFDGAGALLNEFPIASGGLSWDASGDPSGYFFEEGEVPADAEQFMIEFYTVLNSAVSSRYVRLTDIELWIEGD